MNLNEPPDEPQDEAPDEGYEGPATLVLAGAAVEVTVVLRGQFEPIDGFYHWYGRIRAGERLGRLLGTRDRSARLRTPRGEADGQLSDQDTWGRYRIAGRGRPPFPVATSLADLGDT